MDRGAVAVLVLVLAVLTVLVAAKSLRVVPDGRTGVVERLGRFKRTVEPGLQFLVPFVDRIHLTPAAND